MFTGIIEETGAVQSIQNGVHSSRLTISGNDIFQDLALGDSVAVNGVCLTVTARTDSTFTADVMHETLRRSSLGSLTIGQPVNLERALPANGRFGGHIVSGHIDGIGTATKIQRDDNAIWYTFRTDASLLRYIVEKGSIAIDGVSLTVARVTDMDFSVSIIPHTARTTILPTLPIGGTVNLEIDIIAKYLEKLQQPIKNAGSITPELLLRTGYL